MNAGKNLFVSVGLKGSEHADRPVETAYKVQEQGAPTEDLHANSDHELSLSEAMNLMANTVPNGMKLIQLVSLCWANLKKPKFRSCAFFFLKNIYFEITQNFAFLPQTLACQRAWY